MKISNKTLGVIAMICAPAFFVQTTLDINRVAVNSPLGGICDIVYMAGWMCSVIALKRMHTSRLRNKGIVFIVQLISE